MFSSLFSVNASSAAERRPKMAINPTLAARRKKTAKDTEAIHEKASLVSKSSMHPGKKMPLLMDMRS